MKGVPRLISIVIPCYNEGLNVASFYKALKKILDQSGYKYELMYVNDGSTDDTLDKLHKVSYKNPAVRVLSLSRNFGKEIATTAGIHYAGGDAVLMLDGDGQHPPELIPQFLAKWEQGARVVVGVREANQKEGLVKRYGSKLFYRLLNSFTETRLIPGATDYRLIDKVVREEFIRLTERNRITRGLVDWLGFKQDFVYYRANPRLQGEAGYSFSKLLRLALNSFVSLSLKPLYFSFYVGLVILPLSILLALFSVIEMVIGDPMGLNITGTAYLVLVVLFLLGVVLISQGITALYLTHIHTETQNRPIYVVDRAASSNLS